MSGPEGQREVTTRVSDFVDLQAWELAPGNKPFVAVLARITGGLPEQMRVLATRGKR